MVDQPNARFHVVGESSGGLVAAYAALHHPDRIASGSLVSTATFGVLLCHMQSFPDQVRRRGREICPVEWARDLPASR